MKLKAYSPAIKHYRDFYEKMENPEITSEILLRIAEIELKELNDTKAALESYQKISQGFPCSSQKIVSNVSSG